ncbi:hypothetical protein [Curtobacterium sp. MCSS17_008]|uniref:hypothetical protein n=1 Tax=Curtobacterium sp. MCSS17_008 TaxID=2175647 RepID=UPI0011B76A4D|nr:hypothetical protein [Curtobacterium sp. MCSS17_008]
MIDFPDLRVFDECRSAVTDLVDDFTIATALFVLRAACLTRLPSHLAAERLPAPPARETPALNTIAICQLLCDGDALASVAAQQLALFYEPGSLRKYRVTVDEGRIERAVAAFWEAATAGNGAAAATLLGRALDFLSQPLQAVDTRDPHESPGTIATAS